MMARFRQWCYRRVLHGLKSDLERRIANDFDPELSAALDSVGLLLEVLR
ncbi:MAG: hypothetical protein M0017_01360 [Desulfobacteraceae bacterium]|nr:hypothetical protein [Desulfobacteraceae bacterium]